MDFVQSYEKEQQEAKIKNYKKMASSSSKYYGVFGSIISPFMDLKSSKLIFPCESPSNLDLRIAGKYIREISAY